MVKKMRMEKSAEKNDVPAENYDDLIAKKNWMINNQPSNLLELWTETCQLRLQEPRQNIKEIFIEWPRYKDPNCIELINIDFEWLFPNKGSNLFSKISHFEAEMRDVIFPEYIKDKLNVNIFEKMAKTDLKPGNIIE